MNELLVVEFDNLVLPEPAERRSFLLESVKHTLCNQWKLLISVWDWNGSKWIYATLSSHRSCYPPESSYLKQPSWFPARDKVEKGDGEGSQFCHLDIVQWTGFEKTWLLFHLFLAVLADNCAPWWKSTWAGQENLHLPQGGILKHLHLPCDLFRLLFIIAHQLRLKGKMAGMLLLKYSSDRSGAGVSAPQNQFGKSPSD